MKRVLTALALLLLAGCATHLSSPPTERLLRVRTLQLGQVRADEGRARAEGRAGGLGAQALMGSEVGSARAAAGSNSLPSIYDLRP
jgi:hypothetical protein